MITCRLHRIASCMHRILRCKVCFAKLNCTYCDHLAPLPFEHTSPTIDFTEYMAHEPVILAFILGTCQLLVLQRAWDIVAGEHPRRGVYRRQVPIRVLPDPLRQTTYNSPISCSTLQLSQVAFDTSCNFPCEDT